MGTLPSIAKNGTPSTAQNATSGKSLYVETKTVNFVSSVLDTLYPDVEFQSEVREHLRKKVEAMKDPIRESVEICHAAEQLTEAEFSVVRKSDARALDKLGKAYQLLKSAATHFMSKGELPKDAQHSRQLSSLADQVDKIRKSY